MFVKEISTSVTIFATPWRVWRVLSDLEAYSRWNPWLVEVSGELRPGAALAVRSRGAGGRVREIQTRVLDVEQLGGFSWQSEMVFPGLLDRQHVFSLAQIDSRRVRFTQIEGARGLLVPVWAMREAAALELGMERMNAMLKAAAEAAAAEAV